MKTSALFNLNCSRIQTILTSVLSICIALLLSPTGAHANNSKQSSDSFKWIAQESLEIDGSLFISKNFDWFDSQRQRQVPAKLYMPVGTTEQGTVPLIIFSHGIGGSMDGYSYLGRYFAASGYGSLHVQHVGSDRRVWFGNPFSLTSRLSNAAQVTEALNRAKDLRYALDRVLAEHEGSLFDQQRIVAAGHSYGANTALLIAGAQVEHQGQNVSQRDLRISAAILLSSPPFYGMGDPQKILSQIAIPTLHITATEDVILIPGYVSDLKDRLDIFKAIGSEYSSPKVLAVFKEGSHSIFTDRAGTGGLHLNSKVKVATRQLILAFLKSIPSNNFVAVEEWSRSNVNLMSSFQKWPP